MIISYKVVGGVPVMIGIIVAIAAMAIVSKFFA